MPEPEKMRRFCVWRGPESNRRHHDFQCWPSVKRLATTGEDRRHSAWKMAVSRAATVTARRRTFSARVCARCSPARAVRQPECTVSKTDGRASGSRVRILPPPFRQADSRASEGQALAVALPENRASLALSRVNVGQREPSLQSFGPSTVARGPTVVVSTRTRVRRLRQQGEAVATAAGLHFKYALQPFLQVLAGVSSRVERPATQKSSRPRAPRAST